MHQIWLQVYLASFDRTGDNFTAINHANSAVLEFRDTRSVGLIRWLWSLIY